jgi:hypothetical protein
MVGLLEFLVADRRFGYDALDETRAVADRQEVNLPARPPVVEPSADGDLFAVVLRDLIDIGNHRKAVSSQPSVAVKRGAES